MKSLILKRTALTVLLISLISTTAFAQSPKSSVKPKLKLTFQGEAGTNGSAVAWNPSTKMYYATIAGNPEFPLEAFKKNGKPVFQSNVGIDCRGLWYNTTEEKLQLNGAGDNGYFDVKLGQSGQPMGSVKMIVSGKNQPDFQSVGSYDPLEGLVAFYDNGAIYTYDTESGDEVTFLKVDVADYGVYNNTSIICTGNEEYPYGLLNTAKNRVDWIGYDGQLEGVTQLPEDAITGNAFWFSFANNQIFLYDVDMRTWTGYTVF